MKKKLLTVLLIMIGITLSGCEKTETDLNTKLSETITMDDSGAKLVCTTDIDYTEYKYTLGSKYIVFADKDGKVTKIISSEIINSTDENKLKEFEEYLKKNHDVAVQYNGYIFDIKKDKNMVRSDVTIDYTEFDIDKFIKDNSISDMDKDLTVEKVKTQYETLGATCEEK